MKVGQAILALPVVSALAIGVRGAAAAGLEPAPTIPKSAIPQYKQLCDSGVCIEMGADPPKPSANRGVRSRARALTLPGDYPFRTLQLNLCNSGLAPCYSINQGRSVPEALAAIRKWMPDVVTLNEVCKADVSTTLFPAMAENYPFSFTFWAFVPAVQRDNGQPYLCKNGDQYGIGVLGHVFADDWLGLEAFGNTYPREIQDDDRSNEMRSWLCTAAVSNYYACTTHLTNIRGSTAMAQCNYLMRGVVPAVRDEIGIDSPVVVGGDFNLKYKGNPDMQDCVPAGYFRKGDGDVQHIIASDHFTFISTTSIPLQFTDHDGWLVSNRTP